jgi:hypothetical protein
LYRQSAAISPNLQMELHAMDVVGDEGLLCTRAVAFASSLPGIYLPALNTTCSAQINSCGAAAFRNAGTLTAEFSTSATSTARITIIAKADLAENRGALIQPKIDTFSPLPVYIGREGWDCYSFTVPLSAGDHELQLNYSQQADAVTTKGENRSLYILGILVNSSQVTAE